MIYNKTSSENAFVLSKYRPNNDVASANPHYMDPKNPFKVIGHQFTIEAKQTLLPKESIRM